MSKISIQVETPTLELFEEAKELAQAHYEEVEKRSEEHKFHFDPVLLQAIISQGMVVTVVARDEEGGMVGYFANMLSPDTFTNEVVAKEIGIYLTPEARGRGAVKELFFVMEEHLRVSGISLQLIMFKKGHNERVPARLGYEATEVVYQKIL